MGVEQPWSARSTCRRRPRGLERPLRELRALGSAGVRGGGVGGADPGEEGPHPALLRTCGRLSSRRHIRRPGRAGSAVASRRGEGGPPVGTGTRHGEHVAGGRTRAGAAAPRRKRDKQEDAAWTDRGRARRPWSQRDGLGGGAFGGRWAVRLGPRQRGSRLQEADGGPGEAGCRQPGPGLRPSRRPGAVGSGFPSPGPGEE